MAVVKKSLSLSIIDLAEVVRKVEEVEETGQIPEDLIPVFNTSVEAFKEAIDRRCYLMGTLPKVIEMMKDESAYFSRKAKSAERILESIKESTKLFMETNPNLEFRGSHKRLALENNGGVNPIDYKIELQTVANIVDPRDLDMFPKEYLSKIVVFQLDRTGFENDVRTSGLDCKGASLKERGKHVKVR